MTDGDGDCSELVPQDSKQVLLAGVCDASIGAVEIAFGEHVLGRSHHDSYFDVISILVSSTEPPEMRQRRLKLDKIQCREAAPREQNDAASASDGADRSLAPTLRAGSATNISASVNGAAVTIPIMRWMRCAAPAGPRPASWVQYHPTETALEDPKFAFPAVQRLLARCQLPLPALSGRWLLDDEDHDYDGIQALTRTRTRARARATK